MTQQTFDWAYKGEAFNTSASISPYEWVYIGEFYNLVILQQFFMLIPMIFE